MMLVYVLMMLTHVAVRTETSGLVAIDPAPCCISDQDITWIPSPRSLGGPESSYNVRLPNITKPDAAHGYYRFLEIGYKCCEPLSFRLYSMPDKNGDMPAFQVTMKTNVIGRYNQWNHTRGVLANMGWMNMRGGLYFVNSPPYSCSEYRKLRIKWQETEPYWLLAYMEPGERILYTNTNMLFTPAVGLQIETLVSRRQDWTFYLQGRL